jgi:hypothetical protein
MLPRAFVLAFVRWRCVTTVVLAAALTALATPSASHAAASVKTARYHGYRLTVPRNWPVYNLARHPHVCVRFNRHAVYLGRPSSDQDCPARAVGRTEAILAEPLAPTVNERAAAIAAARPPNADADAPGGTAARLISRADGLLIWATWRRDPSVIRRALGVETLSESFPPPKAKTTTAYPIAPGPGSPYTGAGFDVCSTPSMTRMAAWQASPYQAIGVYIGGVNAACSQPNLTAGWVSQESAAGWHLIPIYIGLQAPTNECGCVAIAPARAASQGAGAASDAIAQAEAIGLGPGNPIYFDMENYTRTTRNTSAVLGFLRAWTEQLHVAGYKSGVYSNDDSGIEDLVSMVGTGYPAPDDIWFAAWNGIHSTYDGYIPAADWSNHERLHQYSGSFNATYGGVKLNIDGDYVDAATAAYGTTAAADAVPPASETPPTVAGAAFAGQRLTEQHGLWSAYPTGYAYQWELCDSTGIVCLPIPGATGPTYTLSTADIGYSLGVLETASNPSGAGAAAPSKATAPVRDANAAGGYWLYTAYGNVDQSTATSFYGSPAASHVRTANSITGMASTPDKNGYWLVNTAGKVYAYGDAPKLPHMTPQYPIEGIVAAKTGGYWLYTAHGNVYSSAGTAWYSSPAADHVRGFSITGMAATTDGGGYWLVTASGRVYAFGDAQHLPPVPHANAIEGIVAAPTGGYWLYDASGHVSGTKGTPFFGSPAASQLLASSIAGMIATPDGQGYWLVSATGQVYRYGDAASFTTPVHRRPVKGIAR